MESIPVLIVGAGPAGLAMALALAQNGVRPRIIDKASVYHTGSRGFGLQPRTFEIFEMLGILSDVSDLAVDIPTMRAYKLPEGIEPTKTWNLYEDMPDFPDRPYGNGKCLSQSTLEDIMRAHLSRYDCKVELGKELVAIDQDGSAVNATLLIHHIGGPSSQEIVHAEFVIGADGARGVSRKLLGLTFQGETRDADGMVWADVEIDGLSSDYWHIWGHPGHFTIQARPWNSTTKMFNIGITGQNFDPSELSEPDKVRQLFREKTGRTDLVLGEFHWLSYFRPNMRIGNKFGEGRVFLVGDAAHVHSPTGGQGLNCSIQDSINLAWKMALVHKGLSSMSLLSSYNEERLPVITQMLHATTALYTHAVAKKSTADEAAEDDKKSGWFRWRNNALLLYGVNYRWSSIVLDERDTSSPNEEDMKARGYEGYASSLRAGDRAPEAPGLVSETGKEISLFNLFKPNVHTVLVFVPHSKGASTDRPEINAIIEATKAHDFQTVLLSQDRNPRSAAGIRVVYDRDGYAFKHYFIGDEFMCVVVRQDWMVGAFVRDASGLERYLAKVFRN
ncbi:uncharacterized protein LAESUDRAFT_441502 [Laetiporus sulphureus 93-53]|uniref:FAD-binding domain-containing protein n=1 Tax=Laetiporus sulphureus 93-53 TaxID=1314785 RepID=A0A165C2K1_9APHY|nr:uncharacterized protein LAESUDRAFT_441502 [Laetiporus sulphureus 93-53]KZT02086.1 hypothetical protein LAESUDRAFT_441502 [Laetiporus sulphureus 93-53]